MGVAIQDSLPIFDAPDLTTNTLTSHICTQRLQQPPYITDGPSFIAETRSSMQFLKDLVSLQDELIPKPNLASSSMSALTELSAAIEYRLSIARPPPGNGDSPEILLHEACRLALLICVSYTFRSFCASTMILASLSGRLTRLLQSHLSSLTKNLNIEEKRMLLWIACVGGKPASERSLYAHLVLDMMSDINIVPIFELDALLEEFVWCPRMGDWEFDMLMEEVLMVRAGDVAATETRHCITAGSLGRVVC